MNFIELYRKIHGVLSNRNLKKMKKIMKKKEVSLKMNDQVFSQF